MRRARQEPSAARDGDEVELLDEAEQRALVERYEQQSAASSAAWRRVFAALGGCLSLLLAWAALYHWLYPWQVVFHADFYQTLRPAAVCLADALSAAAIGAASHALLMSHQLQLRVALAAGVGVSLFWFSAWARCDAPGVVSLPPSPPLTRPVRRLYHRRSAAGPSSDVFKLLWLPLAPLYSGVCLTVDAGLRSTAAAVQELRAAQYAHKAL